MQPPIECQPALLKVLLSGRLSNQQQGELDTHLSECDECRRTLERLAAARSWWDGLRHLDQPRDTLSREPSGMVAEPVCAAFRPSSLSVLEPSDANESLGRIGHYE